MSNDVTVRPAAETDLERAREWLVAAGLPTDDLTSADMQNFLVATTASGPVGMVGLEKFGEIGLLRSLVVEPGLRSTGLGGRLVAALEAKASRDGIRELWLLTIDAEAYFAARGYALRDRDDAPAVIRQTPEFASLCPGDAFLMSKRC